MRISLLLQEKKRTRPLHWLILTAIVIAGLLNCRLIENRPAPQGITFVTVTPNLAPSVIDTVIRPTTPSSSTRNEEIPTPQPRIFQIDSAHKTIPEDILAEVSYFVAGGGGLAICSNRTLALVEYTQKIELRDVIYARACWPSDELVRVTLEFPNGRVIDQEIEVDELSAVGFKYVTDLTDPPGIYTVLFKGEQGSIQHSVEVRRPTGPHLYWDDTAKLFFYNFAANEVVRLFAYHHNILVSWQEFKVNPDGQLMVKLKVNNEEDNYHYAAIGDISGEVIPFVGETAYMLNGPEGYIPLAIHHFGLPAFSESIRRANYVAARAEYNMIEVRKEPKEGTSTIIQQVTSDVELKVVSSARMSNGSLWWQVRLNDGTEGWILDSLVEIVK